MTGVGGWKREAGWRPSVYLNLATTWGELNPWWLILLITSLDRERPAEGSSLVCYSCVFTRTDIRSPIIGFVLWMKRVVLPPRKCVNNCKNPNKKSQQETTKPVCTGIQYAVRNSRWNATLKVHMMQKKKRYHMTCTALKIHSLLEKAGRIYEPQWRSQSWWNSSVDYQ